jgi:hypothetical protein
VLGSSERLRNDLAVNADKLIVRSRFNRRVSDNWVTKIERRPLFCIARRDKVKSGTAPATRSAWLLKTLRKSRRGGRGADELEHSVSSLAATLDRRYVSSRVGHSCFLTEGTFNGLKCRAYHTANACHNLV